MGPDVVAQPQGRSARLLAGAAVVAAVLVGGALTGRAVAGPPSAPVVQPVPDCPATAAEAFPMAGPSSTFVVPWGPVNARVCGYGADGAPSGSDVLDATSSAELAGLLHQLPRAARTCTAVPPSADGAVAVVLFRYRPGATPTVGEELRVALATTDPARGCRSVTNGLLTRVVPDDAAHRLGDLAPVLRPVLGVA